jgi:hypothetical protein
MQFYHFIEEGSDTLGFLGPQVAFRPFDTHYLATTSYMKAALCPFMRF